MKNLFSLLIVIIAIFSLCSCSPKNNTEELVDPSSKVNWHGAPFDKCNEYGELLGVEVREKNFLHATYKYWSSEYENYDYAYVSTSLDGGFFYALICTEHIGWHLDTYKKASDDYEGKTYTYKGVKYDLDNPLSSYQLTFADPDLHTCFAWKADNGVVYVQKAIEIWGTKNLIKESTLPEENKSLEGYWYIVRDGDNTWFPTEVFTYRNYRWNPRLPYYVLIQVTYDDTDPFDPSQEGWNKGKISSIIGYFNNGFEAVFWNHD